MNPGNLVKAILREHFKLPICKQAMAKMSGVKNISWIIQKDSGSFKQTKKVANYAHLSHRKADITTKDDHMEYH